MRELKAEAEIRGAIEAEERTGEEMAEKAPGGETRRREEAKARIRVATEVLERAAEEAEWREAK